MIGLVKHGKSCKDKKNNNQHASQTHLGVHACDLVFRHFVKGVEVGQQGRVVGRGGQRFKPPVVNQGHPCFCAALPEPPIAPRNCVADDVKLFQPKRKEEEVVGGGGNRKWWSVFMWVVTFFLKSTYTRKTLKCL